MKIAVCFYGRINKCGDTHPYLMRALPPGHEYHYYLSSDNPTPEDLELFNSLYNPRATRTSKVVHRLKHLEKYDRKLTTPQNMFCHFTNKQRVFRLIPPEEQYDLVMALRCDMIYATGFKFPDIPEVDRVYIPRGEDHYGGLNDQVAYGAPGPMSAYMNIVDLCEEMITKKRLALHPETLTRGNLLFRGVGVERFFMLYKILR